MVELPSHMIILLVSLSEPIVFQQKWRLLIHLFCKMTYNTFLATVMLLKESEINF